MIDAKSNKKRFSLPIELIGPKCTKILDFFIDTGFSGTIKIDKKTFDELGIIKIREEDINSANNNSDKSEIGRVKFQTDKLKGECDVFAFGWGGRNLLGVEFFENAKCLLIVDYEGCGGVHFSNDRELAFKIGKTIVEHNLSKK